MGKGNPSFIDEDGTIILPSLFTLEEERNFKIWYAHNLGKLNKAESFKQICSYEDFDDYRRVYRQIDRREMFFLRFMGRYGSVQAIHIRRMCALYPKEFGLDTTKSITKTVTRLRRLGLVERYQFYQPQIQADVYAYTLTGNGFRFLKYINKKNFDLNFNPNIVLFSRDTVHIRRWQVCDLFQGAISIPGYSGVNTNFLGFHNCDMPGANFSFSLETAKDKYTNFVTFFALEIDKNDYHARTLNKWDKFKKLGHETTPIPGLAGETNLLTFYVPTLSKARNMCLALQLYMSEIDCCFIVGEEMAHVGIADSFYIPSRETDFENCLVQLDMSFALNTERSLGDLGEQEHATDDDGPFNEEKVQTI